MNYGILIWGKVGDEISSSHFRSQTAPIFHMYNILIASDSYKLEVGVLMYQYYQNLVPISFIPFFSKRSDIHGYHTRKRGKGVTSIRPEIKKKKFADKTIRTTGPTT